MEKANKVPESNPIITYSIDNQHCDLSGCTRGEMNASPDNKSASSLWLFCFFVLNRRNSFVCACFAAFFFFCFSLIIWSAIKSLLCSESDSITDLQPSLEPGCVLCYILTKKSFILSITFYLHKKKNPSPSSPLLQPLRPPPCCVIERTLRVSYGGVNALSGGHCQRVEISLSPGLGHNTPVFNLKPKIQNPPASHTLLKRKSAAFELYLGHLFVLQGWQFVRQLIRSPSVWEPVPLCLFDARPKLCNNTLRHNKGLGQLGGGKLLNNDIRSGSSAVVFLWTLVGWYSRFLLFIRASCFTHPSIIRLLFN